MMKNNIKKSLFAALILALTVTACQSGRVEDKRAPGMPGKKTYEILIGDQWIKTTSQGWDDCKMFEMYPECLAETS